MTRILSGILCIALGAATMFGIVEIARADTPAISVVDAGVEAGSAAPPTVTTTTTTAITPPPAAAPATPDPVDAPIDSANFLYRLYKSGGLLPACIVGMFFLLTFLSKTWKWLQEDHRVVYISAALGGLGLLVGPASQGTTPNMSMIFGAVAAAVALYQNPKKPAIEAAKAEARGASTGAATLVMLIGMGALLASSPGCSGSAREARLHDAMAGLTAASSAFVAFDHEYKAHILATSPTDAEFTTKFEAYKATRARVIELFAAAYHSIAAAAVLNKDDTTVVNALLAAQLALTAWAELRGGGQ